MHASDWEKITINWNELTRVQDYEILPRLFQKKVLTTDEKQYFEQTKGMKRKNMEGLYYCLKEKPLRTEAFECLMKCLEETGLEVYICLADKVRNTETKTDPSLICKVDPSHCEDDIRKILSIHFMNRKGTEIPLSRVREVINENEGFLPGSEWSSKELGKFLCRHFGDIIIEKRNERIGNKKVKREYVKHLCEEQQKRPEIGRNSSPGATEEDLDISTLNSTELKSFLQKHFLTEGLPLEPLDLLEKEGISGTLLLTLTEAELEKLIPTPFGARRMISVIIHEYKISNISTNSLYPKQMREFDADVTSWDFYVRGQCIDVTVKARGKRTSRIKNFHSLLGNESEHEKIEYISSEVILFAAACMNERRNGTIYFGINPEITQNHKAGEVIGVSISKENLQTEVDCLLQEAFHEHHRTIIQCTIRSASFVPVHSHGEKRVHVKKSKKMQQVEKCIIEYDIVPESNILKEETFKIRLKTLPHLYKKYRTTDGVARFSDTGIPKILNEKELHEFDADKLKICSQRKIDESSRLKKRPKNLRQMLQNLLTAGQTVIEDDVFVVLGPMEDLGRDDILSSVSFLKHLHPEVIFDFDGKDSSNSIYHSLEDDENMVTRVLTVDDFNAKGSKMEAINELTMNLRNEKHTCWIFCNGYDKLQISPLQSTEWNKSRRKSFTEGLRSFLRIVPNDNVLILICLFSADNEVLLEASEEISLQLPNQWVLLAENDKAVSTWIQTMLDRNRIERSDAEERCIVGMPWHQINRCISEWCNKDEVVSVQIPQSNGSYVNIPEKTVTSWSDIEVVSCSDIESRDLEDEKYLQKKKRLEEEFYRGAQVNWLNFWYNDQVLVREVHDDLKENVVNALEMQRNEEVKAIPVYLNHQPGAGGTTSAKQVLWSLRKKYRCCVVKDITGETSTQLKDLYLYEDNNPRPILVLLDNEEEDKFDLLRDDLEQVIHDLQTEMQEDLNVFCVLLVCVRCTDVSPAKRNTKMIFLKQELHPKELSWFRNKSKELETRFVNQGNDNVNPRFLISFNILKENFNQEYINKVVREFTDKISENSELRLLKYVSLLNTHDISFAPIPVAGITRILQTRDAKMHYGSYTTKLSTTSKWETNLSQSLKVLLNVATKKRRHIPKTVKIFHKLIAIEILKHMMTLSGQSESEMMLELLESVFEDEDRDSREMQRIIKNVIKKRPYKVDEPLKRESFSSLILSVMKNEGEEKAIEILKSLYNFDHNPFTAQQIARSYMEMKNFREAERYVKYATDKLPGNSFLWDTYGQLFKNQLADKVTSLKSLVPSSAFTQKDITESFELFQQAVCFFRKVQSFGEEDNFTGYKNELRCILILLDCLENCGLFSSKEDLHEYLVNESTNPRNEEFPKLLPDEQRRCMKCLYSSSKQAIQKLEEETLQRKAKYSPGVFETIEEEFFYKDYTFLKNKLDEYFGETSDNKMPTHVSEEQICQYKYRQARTKGATSLKSLLDRAETKHSKDFFKSLYNDQLHPIVTDKYCRPEYLKAILEVIIMLSMKGQTSGLSFSQVLKWSYQLYCQKYDDESPGLEKYLYFALFHFPTDERIKYEIGSTHELDRAFKNWVSAYAKKYPKTGKRTGARLKETTLFFLGEGKPLNDLVYHKQLTDVMFSYSRAKKWHLPEIVKLLRVMNGILCEGGNTIKYVFPTREGNIQSLTIQTCMPICQRSWWQKNVYFFLGFSYAGPKAYGVSPEKPTGFVASKPHVDMQCQKNERPEIASSVKMK